MGESREAEVGSVSGVVVLSSALFVRGWVEWLQLGVSEIRAWLGPGEPEPRTGAQTSVIKPSLSAYSVLSSLFTTRPLATLNSLMSASTKHDDSLNYPDPNHDRTASRASQAKSNSTGRSTRVNTIPGKHNLDRQTSGMDR